MLLTQCSTPVAPWYIVPADDKPFRDWAVSRILLETGPRPEGPMPKPNVPSLVRQLPPVDWHRFRPASPRSPARLWPLHFDAEHIIPRG